MALAERASAAAVQPLSQCVPAPSPGPGSAAGDPQFVCVFMSAGSWSPFGLRHGGVFPLDSERVRTHQSPPFSLGTNKNEPFQCFSPLTPRNWNLFLPLKELTCGIPFSLSMGR